MISRTGLKVLGLSRLKKTGYSKKLICIQPCQSLLSTSSYLLYSDEKKNGASELHEAEAHAEEQQREHVFSESHSRDTVDRVDVQVTNHMSLHQMSSSNFQDSVHGPSDSQIEEMSHYEGHNISGSVSLSSVMQSNVPEPFQTSARGSPSHMNMPGGGVKLSDKYLAGHIKDVHPSRKYSTASDLPPKLEDNRYTPYSDCQGTQGDMNFENLARLENPCPQGIQGEDCERFKLWLQNCVRYGGSNCDQDLHAFQSGRKTLNEIFMEQERLIRQVAAQQKRYHSTSSGEKQDEIDSKVVDSWP